MKKITRFYFPALILVIMFNGCSSPEFTLTAEISDPDLQSIAISNQIHGIYDTLDLTQGPTLPIALPDGPSVLKITYGRNQQQYIYAEPGITVTLKKNEKDNDILVVNESTANQLLIEDVNIKLDNAMGKYNIMAIGKFEVEEFLSKVEEKFASARKFLIEKNTGEVNSALVQWLNARLDAAETFDKLNYPQYYEYLNKSLLELPENYFAFVSEFSFSEREPFFFDEYKTAGEMVISHGIDFEEMESIADYYAAIYQNIASFTQDEILKEMFEYKILTDKINYAGGIEGMQEEIKSFIASAQTPHRVENIKQMASEWEHLQKGLEAPDFTAYTREGDAVKLSDLRGKNIYIDVWATWCGPCIAEIPALKAMEEKYHEENVAFVSVSIDRISDREKWLNFIEERQLGGTQLMAQNDWRSEVTTKYNIKGIPRFVFVDKDGKLVTADAPRPSNTERFDQMMASVLE